jgi:hypothetical protein
MLIEVDNDRKLTAKNTSDQSLKYLRLGLGNVGIYPMDAIRCYHPLAFTIVSPVSTKNANCPTLYVRDGELF